VSETAEKPFDATPHRIAKARREGNVARAGELAANLSFAAGGLTVAAIAPAFMAIGRKAVSAPVGGAAPAACVPLVELALVPIGAALVAGALGSIAQSGGFVVLPIGMKPERLNPIEGLKRILSSETIAHSLRASLAFVLAAAAMTPIIAAAAAASLLAATPGDVVAAAWGAVRHLALAACAVGLCFAIAEFGAARATWLRRLRMSFDERKREVKEEEGDAIARGRRRALHRSLLRGGFQQLKNASFVVANPTHIAVALEYRPPKTPVPRVLVRAAGANAIRVRALAVERGIPVVENVWLARALFSEGRAGEPIPRILYVAVAEVVAALVRVTEAR
jgi:flagellar biosynthetic protein FlhB